MYNQISVLNNTIFSNQSFFPEYTRNLKISPEMLFEIKPHTLTPSICQISISSSICHNKSAAKYVYSNE